MPKHSLAPDWLYDSDVRPYVCLNVQKGEFQRRGIHRGFDWFQSEPLLKDSLSSRDFDFVNGARVLDEAIFANVNLEMPRWVYYDCAVMPGMISGFAMRASRLRAEFSLDMVKRLGVKPDTEWVPISLFIIIPTLQTGHWMAHNLCSINEIVPEESRLKGLGFLSKAFGLWYADVEYLFGVTQWGRPALRLHTNYGYLRLVSAYTPLHTYSKSVTYRMKIDSSQWLGFFDRSIPQGNFGKDFAPTGLWIDPQSEESMLEIQRKIENSEGPFYLSGREILAAGLGDRLQLFRPKN